MSTSSAVDTARPPQSRKKHRAILEAATDAFLKAGYGAATMDDIAVQANVSKQTIYHHFGSKEELFAAIVQERCEQFLAPIARVDLEAQDLASTLHSLGVDFLKRVLSSDSLALHRLVVAESARFPELGRLSYDSGARLVVRELGKFLETQAGRNGLSIPDPASSAEQYYGMLLGFLQLRAILCNESEPSTARIESYVGQAVGIFIKGHRQGRPLNA